MGFLRAHRLFRRRHKFILWALAISAFFLCWFLLTLIILLAQEALLGIFWPYLEKEGNRIQEEDTLGFQMLYCLPELAISSVRYELKIQLLSPLPGHSLSMATVDPDSYAGRGIQLLVGHFNGNLPAEKAANLTFEELNANVYAPRKGAGEQGRPVEFGPEEEARSERTFSINQFNLLASDSIALNRSLPDVRRIQCRQNDGKWDIKHLPNTSIIIVFHNEAFSTLARTITSVINRSPHSLLHQLILVDDFSNRTFLHNDLHKFVRTLPIPTKLLRAKQRVGLIRARLMGAQEADGQVLTFLDSHCECTQGWLEPLLARIVENRKAVVCPIIDVINDRSFAYQKGIELFRGGFNWNLQFRWYSVPAPMARQRHLSDPTAPIPSPTMAGGLFSMDRSFFFELGAYDPDMDIWGGENLELSFRVWQCGGRVEILPCSHVGHVFRHASPHEFPKGGNSAGRVLNANLARVSEVWMDQWRHFFHKVAPQAMALVHSLDVSERMELKRKLGCKDFGWFLENVWSDHFLPPLSTDDSSSIFGRFRHISTNLCLLSRPSSAGKKHRLNVGQCSLGFDLWQFWVLSAHGKDGFRLMSDEHQCLSAIEEQPKGGHWRIQLKECGEHDMEFWRMDGRGRFVHQKSGLCLDEPKGNEPIDEFEQFGKSNTEDGHKIPTLSKCGWGKQSQKWEMVKVEWLPAEK